MSGYAAYGRRGSSGGFLQQLMGREIEDYYAQRQKKQRGEELTSALKRVYGGLSEDQVSGVADLALAGMPPSGAKMEEMVAGGKIDALVAQLPPELRQTVAALPYEQKKQAVIGYAGEQIKKGQREAAFVEFANLNDQLPKDDRGAIAWGELTEPQAAKYLETLSGLADDGRVPDEIFYNLWNYAVFKQFQDPTTAGKAKKAVGSQTVDDMAVLEFTGKYADTDWPEIPPMVRATIAVSDLKIKTAEDWAEFQGKIKVPDKAITTASEGINSRLESMLPFEYKLKGITGLFADWQLGNLDRAKYPALVDYLERNYYPDKPGEPKIEGVLAEARRNTEALETLKESINLPGYSKQIYHDVYGLIAKGGGQWKDPDFTQELQKRWYTDKDIEVIRTVFNAIVNGDQAAAIEKLKGTKKTTISPYENPAPMKLDTLSTSLPITFEPFVCDGQPSDSVRSAAMSQLMQVLESVGLDKKWLDSTLAAGGMPPESLNPVALLNVIGGLIWGSPPASDSPSYETPGPTELDTVGIMGRKPFDNNMFRSSQFKPREVYNTLDERIKAIGRINLNDADEQELMLLPGVNRTLAENILKHGLKLADKYVQNVDPDRIMDGTWYENIEQLLNVPGMTPEIFEKIKPYLGVSNDPTQVEDDGQIYYHLTARGYEPSGIYGDHIAIATKGKRKLIPEDMIADPEVAPDVEKNRMIGKLLFGDSKIFPDAISTQFAKGNDFEGGEGLEVTVSMEDLEYSKFTKPVIQWFHDEGGIPEYLMFRIFKGEGRESKDGYKPLPKHLQPKGWTILYQMGS